MHAQPHFDCKNLFIVRGCTSNFYLPQQTNNNRPFLGSTYRNCSTDSKRRHGNRGACQASLLLSGMSVLPSRVDTVVQRGVYQLSSVPSFCAILLCRFSDECK